MINIEFTGMPKAGKTTLTEVIETALKQEHKVKDIYEAARINPLDKSNRFYFNSWCFHDTMNRLMEAESYGFDFGLIDRGVYDHIAFAKTLLKLEKINESECESQINYFLQFARMENYILFFVLDPKISLDRYKPHNFSGKVMNADFLNVLSEAYSETIELVDQPYSIINGSDSLEDNKRKSLEIITGLLENK